MLNKLLKYDLKYMIKNMSIFYILSIFFFFVTRILFAMKQSVIINIVGQISVGCMYSMIASTLINTLMRSWVRFRTSIYKDEAYLTHTLPVSKNNLYDSKFIQTLIFFILGFVIVLLSLFIAYYTPERWQMIKDYIGTITTGLSMKPALFIIGFVAVTFLEIFNAIQCGFLGIILGHKKNDNRVAFSVLFGFIAYILVQSIVLFLVYVVGLFNPTIMDLFNNTILLDASSFKLLIFLAIILYLLIIGLMSILCKHELNKGVNIE